jgi:uncharacterized protein (DUF488 family)
MNVFTIGFTHKSAERFFETLRDSEVYRVVDVRLNNVSQLSGFAKKNDLKYFLKEICRIEYIHLPQLAPTKEMLDEYRKKTRDWAAYERQFLDLLRQREVEKSVPREIIKDGCLLCSEERPLHCHRRLVAEYLEEQWGGVAIKHLV